jgi:hypothetical protein
MCILKKRRGYTGGISMNFWFNKHNQLDFNTKNQSINRQHQNMGYTLDLLGNHDREDELFWVHCVLIG